MNPQQQTEEGWGVYFGADSFTEARAHHAALGLSLHDWHDALDKAAFYGRDGWRARLFWVKPADRHPACTCGHQHAGPELGGVCVGCACGGTK